MLSHGSKSDLFVLRCWFCSCQRLGIFQAINKKEMQPQFHRFTSSCTASQAVKLLPAPLLFLGPQDRHGLAYARVGGCQKIQPRICGVGRMGLPIPGPPFPDWTSPPPPHYPGWPNARPAASQGHSVKLAGDARGWPSGHSV